MKPHLVGYVIANDDEEYLHDFMIPVEPLSRHGLVYLTLPRSLLHGLKLAR